MYRVAHPARFLTYGGLAQVLVFTAAAILSVTKPGAARFVWTAGGVLTVLLAVVVRRRLSARASEYIQMDDAAITSFAPAGFRSLPWEAVARLRVKRWGAVEVSDARTAGYSSFAPCPEVIEQWSRR